MSKINVDTWEPESGTAATLMATGDTVTLPSGAILAVASGGDINVASGGEIDIASGATLDVNGTIDLTGATKTGFPAGGLTAASQWRLTTDFTGAVDPLALNLEEVDAPVGFGVLGSSMTVSSGVFTFPATGYWHITAFGAFLVTTDSTSRSEIGIFSTINDSTYIRSAQGFAGTYYETSTGVCSYIMDVTDVTQCKVRFTIDQAVAGTTTKGDTAANETFFTFMRLADT